MKQSSLTAKLLKAKKASQSGSPKAGQPKHAVPRRGRHWKWSLALLCIALTAGVSYGLLYFFILSKIPHAMVGTWVVMDVKTKGDAKADESLRGGKLQFHRDGTMIGTINMDGKEGKIKAAVEVEGDVLRITSVNPHTGKPVTDVQTIRTLEGDRFVIEDRKGTVLIMERLRE